jgi:hypothetical protein
VQANNEHIYLNYTSDRYANAELLVQSGQLKEESGSGYAQLDFQLLGVDQTSLPTESL